MVGYDRILDELKKRGDGKPEAAEILPLYVALLSAQARVQSAPCDFTALENQAATRLQQGLPILSPEAFQADDAALLGLGKQVCAITAQYRPELSSRFDAIAAWLDRHQSSLRTLAVEFLREGRVRAGEEGLEESLLAYLFNNLLHPFLRKYAKALAHCVDQDAWYRPRCPICGGEPDFAALAKETGARRLLCSRCDFEWAFWRVACPFCQDDEPERQTYALSEDRVYRLYTCNRCNRYLKTIDLREVADERVLPVERVLTFALDLSAQQAGYSAASPRAG